MLRTHTCGQLRKGDDKKQATLCGWVHARRDHGKLIFIDIRDRYGLTQVVFVPSVSNEAHENAQKLGPEFVIQVTGMVNARPAKMVNPDLATGEIELCAEKLSILNDSKVPVFEIDDNTEVSEELRLTYRYLDLRREKLQKALTTRNDVCYFIRQYLQKEKFLEVETPVLTKSTPEGARDYLVPSRLNHGKLYALPQSPQLFKQIMMIGGLDKYFQIVKCFRDEDLRADRQPEFTQLDMEMAFVDQEDVFAVTEGLFQFVFKNVIGVDLKIPFRRLPYGEAMGRYQSDKPDLRKEGGEFAFAWIVDFPLFQYNENEKRWESEHHPFTQLNKDDLVYLNSQEFGKIRSCSYDLVLNGHELGSGSIRIHKKEIQQKIFDVIGLKQQEADERFGFLMRALEYGAPPHAGIAFGVDRLIAILCGLDSIRDTIAFPKTQKANCLLSGAPSDVSAEQLRDIGVIAIKKGGGNE